MKACLTIWLLLCASINLFAQGYIVPNGVTHQRYSPGIGYTVHVLQNPTNLDYTGFALNPLGITQPSLYVNTFSFDHYVDEGVRVFLVSSNQPITAQAIQSGSYTELMYPGGYVFNHNSPFYVGLYTGYNPFTSGGVYTGIYTEPLFGWARLRNNQGVIELLGSALAYGSQGMYAGTQNMIPEPSGFALVVIATLLFGSRRKTKLRK